MHITNRNQYQMLINRFSELREFKVTSNRDGWTSLYRGITPAGKGERELFRRVVQANGDEFIYAFGNEKPVKSPLDLIVKVLSAAISK